MVLQRIPAELPKRVPLFPLPGVVLLPFGHVPLNVFEPRYLNMVDDALGADRFIAMIQPRETHPDPVPDDAPLYDIGTVGRIVQFQDAANGRYQITLEGLIRFRLTGVAPADGGRGYRVGETDFAGFEDDMQPTERDDGPGRAQILDLMRGYFDSKDIAANWESVSQAPYEALVTSLAMTCPFSPGEKQALLECASHEGRARMLISLFEMSDDTGNTGGGLTH